MIASLDRPDLDITYTIEIEIALGHPNTKHMVLFFNKIYTT